MPTLAPERILQRAPSAIPPKMPWGQKVIQIMPDIGELEPRFYPGGCFLAYQKSGPKLNAAGNGFVIYADGLLGITQKPCSVQRSVSVPRDQTELVGIVRKCHPNKFTEAGTVLWLSDQCPSTQDCIMVVRRTSKEWVDGFIYQPRAIDLNSGKAANKSNLRFVQVNFAYAWIIGKAHWLLSNV